ncbi:MAG: hypothetical protein K2O52_05420, partial [Oscillospiraceae bacterium]|nr:hypothetical protein [Oscillospiraceae bacterium]
TNININTNSESETKSTTIINNNSESNANSTTTSTSLLSSTAPTTTEIIDPTESPLQLEMQEALQIAIDEEERQAIQDVQETRETAIYYKDPTLDFDSDNFQNLNMQNINLPRIQTSNGDNVHTHFFEAKSMSGNNLLQMQKMANYFADVQINIEKINASAETLEDSEYLIYNSDSLYLEYQNSGKCILYRPDIIQEFTGEEISENWNPLEYSTNLGEVRVIDNEQNVIFNNEYIGGMVDEMQTIYLNGEETTPLEIKSFVSSYLRQAKQNLGLSSLYEIGKIQDCELLEFSNGIQGFYLTLKLYIHEAGLNISSTQKSAFLNEEQQTCPQEIKLLMFTSDSIAYIELPEILIQEPDTIETLSGTYCTANEACTILSDYLNQDYIYTIHQISIIYQPLFLYQDNQYAGIVQAPMYHFVMTNPDTNSPYKIIYADIALDTKQLYISYS